MTLLDLLLLLVVLLSFGRIYVPWASPPLGTVVLRRPLTLLARLRLHRGVALVAVAVAAVGVATGRVHPWSVLVAIALLVVLLDLPVDCALTDLGIAVGRTRFRRWTEFGGVSRRPGGARLQGVAGTRRLTIWLADSRDDDDFVLLLRRCVRDAYKGDLRDAGQPEAAGGPNGASPPSSSAIRATAR